MTAPQHLAGAATKYGKDHPRWRGGRHVTVNGYVTLLTRGHPQANSTGGVYEHILVAEQAMRKHLPKGAEVHHINEVKSDNSNTNLVVCQDHSYHALLHLRGRALREHGDANARKCVICKQWDTANRLTIRPRPMLKSQGTALHLGCERARDRARRRNGGIK